MHDGLLGFLKQARPLLRVLRLLTLQKPFKQFSLTSKFKSPTIRILSYLFRYTSISLFRWCRWLEILLLCGLEEQWSNHFFFRMLTSTKNNYRLSFIVSATYGSRDFGIVLENLSSSRFFLFFLSKCYRGQTKFKKIEPGVYNLKL